MSSGKQNTQNHPQRPRNQRRERQPALTHFLCLPLVNTVSLPQLEESIAAFTRAYPPVPVADLLNSQHQTSEPNASQALIPQGAVRPVGTIHLTIGVMSLPTKERLNEALAFFQTLDLAGLLREAERVACELRQKRASKLSSSESAPKNPEASSNTSDYSSDKIHTPQPLCVSLESLHALPRAKAATVLHASPSDPTGRLYPFCVMLRDKFIEAGFMLSEAKNGLPTEKRDPKAGEEVQASQCQDLNTNDKSLLEEMTTLPTHIESTGGLKNLDPYAAALARRPKPRPLLLHATLVNTIYVRGRRKFESGKYGGKHGRNGSKRLEFDARGILARYRNYYVDETQMTPRVDTSTHFGSSTGRSSLSEREVPTGDEAATESNPETSSANSNPQYPFVWAKNIPINSVTICEMGAKKLEIGGPGDQGLNARLGEEYTVIAERSLDSRPRSTSPS
ncbi:hypothetical protein F1880_003438 [Penicillium rolfsii]|nr:hypothetical protein F1880_003438 [Penicillium rolfsii]